MSEIKANWSISLNCDCPKCDEYVDLLDYDDFWDSRNSMQVCEQDTPITTNVEVTCPKCLEVFIVDFQY